MLDCSKGQRHPRIRSRRGLPLGRDEYSQVACKVIIKKKKCGFYGCFHSFYGQGTLLLPVLGLYYLWPPLVCHYQKEGLPRIEGEIDEQEMSCTSLES